MGNGGFEKERENKRGRVTERVRENRERELERES